MEVRRGVNRAQLRRQQSGRRARVGQGTVRRSGASSRLPLLASPLPGPPHLPAPAVPAQALPPAGPPALCSPPHERHQVHRLCVLKFYLSQSAQGHRVRRAGDVAVAHVSAGRPAVVNRQGS